MNSIFFIFGTQMSCTSYLQARVGCTASNADPQADGLLVGPQIGNDFRFYGLIGGPGIEIGYTPETVQIGQRPLAPVGRFGNMGADMTFSSPVNVVVDFDYSGLGQYNNFTDDIIPITTNYTVSWSVNYIADGITITLEDSGQVLARSQQSFVSPTPLINTLTSTRNMELSAGSRPVLRIVTTTGGQLLLSTSYFTLASA